VRVSVSLTVERASALLGAALDRLARSSPPAGQAGSAAPLSPDETITAAP
jgi:hypothetical protein